MGRAERGKGLDGHPGLEAHGAETAQVRVARGHAWSPTMPCPPVLKEAVSLGRPRTEWLSRLRVNYVVFRRGFSFFDPLELGSCHLCISRDVALSFPFPRQGLRLGEERPSCPPLPGTLAPTPTLSPPKTCHCIP